MCAGIEFKKVVFFKLHSKVNYDNNLGLFTINVNILSTAIFILLLIEYMNSHGVITDYINVLHYKSK